MKVNRRILPAILFFISASCSRSPLTFQDLRPQKIDGVLNFPMNNTSEDERLFGAWAAPQLGRDKHFVRDILEQDSGLFFDTIKVEPLFIETEITEMPSKLEIKVNENSFPVTDKNFRLMVPADVIQSGRNRLSFSFPNGEKVVLKQMRIYPRRFGRFQKIFNPEADSLTPSRFHYFLNPENGMELRLVFLFSGQESIPATVTIESEKNRKSYEQLIRTKKEVLIKPVDESLHHILIEMPETALGHLRLIQSRLASRPPKTSRNIPYKKLSKDKNVLIILLDAARADHLSCYNYRRPTTPNIDALAEESFLFGNAVSEAAYTLGSTGTLLTGLPPDFHGVISAFYSRLDDGLTTLPQLFEQRGYFTAAVTSNAYFGKSYNFAKGFAKFVEIFQNKEVVLAEDFLAPLKEILAAKKEKPFFVFLHLREPHFPYAMPKPFFGKYQKRYSEADEDFNQKLTSLYFEGIKDPSDLELLKDSYDENLDYADSVVGKILKILKEKNLFDQTIKIITADHGEGLGEHGLVSHNIVLYKEGIHVPLIIHIPGAPVPRRSLNHPVITSDLIVTLCHMFNLPYPYSKTTMGRDLFIPDEKRIRICRSVVLTNKYSGYMVESFPYKLILFPSERKTAVDLFDIQQDPEEMRPLSDSPLARQALRFFLNDFIKRSSQWVKIGEKPELSQKELERLKSLGYIH